MRLPAAICGLLLLCGCAPVVPLNVHVRGDGRAEPCAAEIDGQRIESESLATVARPLRRREAHVTIAVGTPYRCIGAVIYALQRAGFTRIGFISQPAIEE